MTDDEQRLAAIATVLADGLELHLGPWLRRAIDQRSAGAASFDLIDGVVASIIGPLLADVRTLLATDIDDQRSNPLAIVRAGLGPATDLLRSLGAPPVERDPFVVQAFPDDHYALAPATFGDIDESLQEAGLMWGAAKAHVHLRRRRAEGLL